MLRKHSEVVALPLLVSTLLILLFEVFGSNSTESKIDNEYLSILNRDNVSVKLECKKNIHITEILPTSYKQHKCLVGGSVTLDDSALYVTIRVPQGQLIIDLGKEK